MKLVIKAQDEAIRLPHLSGMLNSIWSIVPVDYEDESAWFRAMETADAVITMAWSSSPPSCENLKLIQLPGAGFDAIELDKTPGHSAVCNVYEHEIPISEFILASMLEWTIGLSNLDRNMRSNNWSGSYLFGPTHNELYGKTVGIIGYGSIGRAVAKRVKSFGVTVLACGPREPKGGEPPQVYYPLDRINELLKTSDFIVIAAPLVEETNGLLSTKEIEQMKPTGVIINVARGAIVDESALYTACRDNSIGGAIIDTWYDYPSIHDERTNPSKYNFSSLDNVIMTPHASAWTDGLVYRRNKCIAENMNRLALGKTLLNLVKEPFS